VRDTFHNPFVSVKAVTGKVLARWRFSHIFTFAVELLLDIFIQQAGAPATFKYKKTEFIYKNPLCSLKIIYTYLLDKQQNL